ncbi:MAG: hypothetical protein MUO63_05980, partial [Desulfobulbaceae bacterium]|nr:hypothetical protein [Desulfobulbaceae bacterium]
MKTLFTEEIIAEEQHMQEITKIGLMQEEPEAKPVAVQPPAPAKETSAAKTASARDTLKKTDSAEPPPQPPPPAASRKSLYAGIAVAITLVIALLTTF